ncbi:MAG: nucleoside monophosphate kinase [Phototrophicaceae bacterium]
MGLYVILMGVQGAGKGVQANYIKETYEIPHVSTGDIFRGLSTRTDELAERVKAILAAGDLVDDDTTNELVADRLNEADAADGVILDGYPRNQVQADFLDHYLAEKGEKVNSVLYLDLDLYIAFKRAFGRVTHAGTGESFNYFYKKGDVNFSIVKDDNKVHPPRIVGTLDGTELKRRVDDADALAVINRIETYLQETMPIVDYYRGTGIVTEIHADMPIDVVSYYIKTVLDAAK